ncbi:hypothetical protein P692DRAFT_201872977 [Suillus brevipes Sb2]|nr:hypothetical protein P692DRAFT_201872977 [Suillus brevipes Sb2]
MGMADGEELKVVFDGEGLKLKAVRKELEQQKHCGREEKRRKEKEAKVPTLPPAPIPAPISILKAQTPARHIHPSSPHGSPAISSLRALHTSPTPTVVYHLPTIVAFHLTEALEQLSDFKAHIASVDDDWQPSSSAREMTTTDGYKAGEEDRNEDSVPQMDSIPVATYASM